MAALAGLFSALVLPLVWSRFGDSGSAGSLALPVAFLAAVALPAHAFVMGFGRSEAPDPRTLDKALLVRIGVWLGAAVATVALSAMFRA